MRVEGSIDIDIPVAQVFDYVADVDNYPDWMAHVLEVRKDAPGRPQQGDRFTVAIKSLGRRFETTYERVTYEPNRRCTDSATGGPVSNQRWHCVFQDVSGGTRLSRAVEAELEGVLKLLQPLQKRVAKRQLGVDLRTLKDVLEAR